MPQLFDIFLPCAPKDFHKLPYVARSIVEHMDGWDDLWVCSPVEVPQGIRQRLPEAHYGLDSDILPRDRSRWVYRPDWCFQQHLKLFQRVTGGWYLTVDCDTVYNRSVAYFNGETPIWYRGFDQYNPPYFVFNQAMIGVGRVTQHTWVADMNLFFRPIIDEMLRNNGYTVESFIEKSQRITTKECYMAEPELYGHYCAKHHPGFYEVRQLRQRMMGRDQRGEETPWREAEVRTVIEESKGHDWDVLSLHSWT